MEVAAHEVAKRNIGRAHPEQAARFHCPIARLAAQGQRLLEMAEAALVIANEPVGNSPRYPLVAGQPVAVTKSLVQASAFCIRRQPFFNLAQSTVQPGEKVEAVGLAAFVAQPPFSGQCFFERAAFSCESAVNARS